MSIQVAILYSVFVLSTFRTISFYLKQKEQWDQCPHPIGLWYCSVVVTFNCSMIFVVLSLHFRSLWQVSTRRTIKGIFLLLQAAYFVWVVVGTVWVCLTVRLPDKCV